MQQPEILSLAERLIPAYKTADFEFLLGQMTEGQAASVKILVKMELGRIMTPCSKPIDLRGKVKGECREYQLNGLTHWLDDVAFNAYHKNTQKFGGYTEGVWDALCNTHNNFRVMQKRSQSSEGNDQSSSYGVEVEAITIGHDLKRKENRLKVAAQVELLLPKNKLVHAVIVDLSPSGAKFKVPSAMKYQPSDIIAVKFTEFNKTLEIEGLNNSISYRVVAIDDSYENDAIKYLRVINLDSTEVIKEVIEHVTEVEGNKTRQDNKNKIISARVRSFEHTFLKHTCSLPIFFSGSSMKLVLTTENNKRIWQYWTDERNQQALNSLFQPQRVSQLIVPGASETSNTIYSFTHEHQSKRLFFSMMAPEASQELRNLFFHIGARRSSWRVFKLTVFELSNVERQAISEHSHELELDADTLTHCAVLQEIADSDCSADYLLSDKPNLANSQLNRFRHDRNPEQDPTYFYFDSKALRRETRYSFQSPLRLSETETLHHEGTLVDISNHGANIVLQTPCKLRAGSLCTINFLELNNLDKKLSLQSVCYQIIKISPGGQKIQLAIVENEQTEPVINFFETLINHNKEKLNAIEEFLPSDNLIEGLHHILISKISNSPIFVEKRGKSLRPRIIGVKAPFKSYVEVLAQLGEEQKFSLGPIYKGRANSLLAQPMKPVSNPNPQFNELYITIAKFGNRIQNVESKLREDFSNTKERVEFIKHAQTTGDVYVLRINSLPVLDPITTLTRKNISELVQINLSTARNLEKEIQSIVGFAEFTDITEEVLLRLGISHQ